VRPVAHPFCFRQARQFRSSCPDDPLTAYPTARARSRIGEFSVTAEVGRWGWRRVRSRLLHCVSEGLPRPVSQQIEFTVLQELRRRLLEADGARFQQLHNGPPSYKPGEAITIPDSDVQPRSRSNYYHEDQNDRARFHSRVGVNGAPEYEPSRFYRRRLHLPHRAQLPAVVWHSHHQRWQIVAPAPAGLYQMHLGHLRLWCSHVCQTLPLSCAPRATATRRVPSGMRSQRVSIAQLLPCGLCAMLAKVAVP